MTEEVHAVCMDRNIYKIFVRRPICRLENSANKIGNVDMT